MDREFDCSLQSRTKGPEDCEICVWRHITGQLIIQRCELLSCRLFLLACFLSVIVCLVAVQ